MGREMNLLEYHHVMIMIVIHIRQANNHRIETLEGK